MGTYQLHSALISFSVIVPPPRAEEMRSAPVCVSDADCGCPDIFRRFKRSLDGLLYGEWP